MTQFIDREDCIKTTECEVLKSSYGASVEGDKFEQLTILEMKFVTLTY